MQQKRLPALSGWYYVPYEAFAEGMLDQCKEVLSHTPRNAEPGDSIPLYRDYPSKEVIALPRSWGMEAFPGEYRDFTSRGSPLIGVSKMPDPNHPAVKDPEAQAKFMADLVSALETYSTFIATAPTGSGKTVSALYAAAETGTTTLIGVHLEQTLPGYDVFTRVTPLVMLPGKHMRAAANYFPNNFQVLIPAANGLTSTRFRPPTSRRGFRS